MKKWTKEYQKEYMRSCRIGKKRHSGKDYENSPERLEEIKNKYKNGVTVQDIENMVRGFV